MKKANLVKGYMVQNFETELLIAVFDDGRIYEHECKRPNIHFDDNGRVWIQSNITMQDIGQNRRIYEWIGNYYEPKILK